MKNLEAVCDSIIDDIVAAQDSTGYLHTQYMLEFSHPAAPSPDQKNVKTFRLRAVQPMEIFEKQLAICL